MVFVRYGFWNRERQVAFAILIDVHSDHD